MEKEFDEFEFENYLTDEFFSGNEKNEIGKLINQRLAEDSDFKEHYEQWLEESDYNNWKEFYQKLDDDENSAWENMSSRDDD
ncbi:MAG: hypothetical protein ACOYMA_10190 [Bacteroidia bacterium]